MATINDIRARAQALRDKTESNSITATEVGNLLLDLAEVAQVTERDGAILGIRKVYPSVDTLNADKVAPQGADGKPLRKGNLVVVYNKSTEQTDPNTGMVYIYRGDSWEMAGRLGGFDLVELISRQLREEVQVRSAADTALQQTVDSLRQDATQADTTLQQAVDSLRQDATQADTELRESVTREATARIQDDANLLLQVQAEQRERVAADERLRQEMTHARQELQEYADKAGKVKSVSVNGVRQPISESGEVDITIEGGMDAEAVDAAIEEKVKPLRQPRFNVDAETGDEGVTLTFSTESGEEIAKTTFAGGGGGNGGSDTATARILLAVRAEKKVLQKGETCTLRYTYNHLNTEGGETGVNATITMAIQQGLKAPITLTKVVAPSEKQHELDLSDYTKEVGTLSVRLSAVAEDGLKKNAAVTLDVRELRLSLQSTECISVAANGGHRGGSVVVPYRISGAGSKDVTLLVNGQHEIKEEGLRSVGTTTRQMTIPSSVLTEGCNTIQMQAEADGLTSECIYFDLLYNPQQHSTPFVGVYIENTHGTLQRGGEHAVPRILATQYENVTLRFVSYKVDAVQLLPDGKVFASALGLREYTRRYKTEGLRTLTLSGGGAAVSVQIEVGAANVGDIGSEVGVVADYDADGRSNEESERATWGSGEHSARFEDVDFISSGWAEGALRLRSGAKTYLSYRPFATDPATEGWTMEVELRTDTALDDEVAVASCMESGKGFAIYPNKAALFTGQMTEVETEDGSVQIAEGLQMPLSTERYTRIAFVVHPKREGGLMELYADGVRVGAGICGEASSFVQNTPQEITLSSEAANVDIRQVKAYSRALTDDELLGGYILSRVSAEEMKSLQTQNDVLNSQGNYEAARTAKRGRLFFKRKGGLAEVFQCTDKKKDFLCEEVRFESPFGAAFDFVAHNVNIRIQGTSSTKYPHKNIRIYLDKGKNPELYVNGKRITGTSGDAKADAKKNKYAMSEGAKAVSIFTCKCDYSDSSMTHNTGFATLWHTLCSRLGIVTPAQKTDKNARASIEGYPIDIYNQDEDGGVAYFGQYNFNNDKSKSDAVFGMAEIDTERGACSLEFLNNMQPLCLFQTRSENDFSDFDKALEFNIPDGLKWDTATEGQRTAVKRLWNFVGNAVRECGVSMDSPMSTYGYLDTFRSGTFKAEAKRYFDVDNMLLWYLFTEFLALVDQRAKNMILRTWDGEKWYFTYYDGDTALGVRNDSFLAYAYDVERSTRDLQLNKYAFEGYTSWLWCLVLANFEKELTAMAERLRSVMTTELVFEILHDRQMGTWSKRAYNKSGELKYIIPAVKGTLFADASGVTSLVRSNYIHALQGDRLAHRRHFIKKRFAYIDAKYRTSSYASDQIPCYLSRTAAQSPCVVGVTAAEVYRFGYGTNNRAFIGLSEAIERGSKTELSIVEAFTVNDPLRIYGASAIRELDLTKVVPNGVSEYPLQNNLVLSACKALRKIDARLPSVVTTASFRIDLSGVTSVEWIDVSNIRGVAIGNSAGQLNCAGLPRLKYLNGRGTGAVAVTFAEGATLEQVYFPEEIQTLTLRSLPKLRREGLHIANHNTITTLNFTACPHLDWKELLRDCSSLQRVRVEGVKLRGDGTDLDNWKSLKGVAANGALVSEPRLMGTYQLTRWREDIAALRAAFPELAIRQPEYTLIEFAEDIMDERNVTNEDNQTGYRYGKPYAPSGHITAILAMRHRVMAKERGGKWIYTLLDDATAERYADGSPANLEGADGEIYICEPRYWTKGINDFLRKRKYAVYASVRPTAPAGIKVERNELQRDRGVALQVGNTLSASRIANAGWSTYSLDLPREMRQVRWTPSNGLSTFSLFLDADNNVVRRFSSVDSNGGMLSGMYLFTTIPEGAVRLVFAHKDDEEFGFVWLTHSLEVADIEPEWVEHQPKLVGAVKVDTQLRSVIHQNLYSNMTHSEAESAAKGKGAGWEMMQYDTWRDIVHLIIAKYGSITYYGHARTSNKNMGNSLVAPIDRVYYMRKNTTKDAYYLVEGVEVDSNYHTHTLGYDRWMEGTTEWLGGFAQVGGYGIGDGSWRYQLGNRTTLPNRNNWGSGWTGYLRYVMHGLYMDLGYVSQGVSSTQRYRSSFNVSYQSWRSYACNIWNSDDDGRNLLHLWDLGVNYRGGEMSIRLQYTGDMEEVTLDNYKDR